MQVILFEIYCAIFYTNLHELFCQFISWKNWVYSGRFIDNCWISCQIMDNMKKVYDNRIIINMDQGFIWLLLSLKFISILCLLAFKPRTMDTQWRHKSKISEKLGQCGRQNMLRPYQKFGIGIEFSALQLRLFCLRASVVSGFVHFNVIHPVFWPANQSYQYS